MTTTPDRKPLRIVDLTAGVILGLIGALVGFLMLAYMTRISQLSAICDGVSADGVRCSPDFLNVMIVIGIGIVIFAWFVSIGFFIVRVLQRKVAFFLPLIGIAAMIVGYYLVLIILAASYQPA